MVKKYLAVILCALLFFGCATTKQLPVAPCAERYKWQYEDYTKKYFFVNQVFSKGFGLYISVEGAKRPTKSQTDSVGNMIGAAFRTALTNWGVALIMVKDKLPVELKNYIDDNTFKDGGRSLYNAPQVFNVDCPEDANFVIRVYIPACKKFPDVKQVLAKAQISGRAIMMNMQSQKVIYNQRFFDVQDGMNNYNLVPILAHELGHCFGLQHSSGYASIMAATALQLSRFPTAKDGLNFATILQTQITGAAPGFFSPTECVGLKTE
jgi:hypothetical protein